MLEIPVMKDVLIITCEILQKNFYYDLDALKRVLKALEERFIEEYEFFEETADVGYMTRLKYDYAERRHFTLVFASLNIHEILIEELFFSELELDCFEKLLDGYSDSKRREEAWKN